MSATVAGSWDIRQDRYNRPLFQGAKNLENETDFLNK